MYYEDSPRKSELRTTESEFFVVRPSAQTQGGVSVMCKGLGLGASAWGPPGWHASSDQQSMNN